MLGLRTVVAQVVHVGRYGWACMLYAMHTPLHRNHVVLASYAALPVV